MSEVEMCALCQHRGVYVWLAPVLNLRWPLCRRHVQTVVKAHESELAESMESRRSRPVSALHIVSPEEGTWERLEALINGEDIAA